MLEISIMLEKCGANGWDLDTVEAIRLVKELVHKPREIWV
jgi:hypothetical protein